jgi:hypothetical protein
LAIGEPEKGENRLFLGPNSLSALDFAAAGAIKTAFF